MRKERNDRGAGVAANDCDVFIGRIRAFELRNETGSADDVKGGDTKEALRIVDAFRFEDLRADWYRGVDLGSVSAERQEEALTIIQGSR